MGGCDRAAIILSCTKICNSGNDETDNGNFFAALNAPARKPAIHVLHYGDSKSKATASPTTCAMLGSPFGGGGPGFLSPVSHVRALLCGNLGPVNGNAIRALVNKTPPYSDVSDSWRRCPARLCPYGLYGRQRACDLNPILGATSATLVQPTACGAGASERADDPATRQRTRHRLHQPTR